MCNLKVREWHPQFPLDLSLVLVSKRNKICCEINQDDRVLEQLYFGGCCRLTPRIVYGKQMARDPVIHHTQLRVLLVKKIQLSAEALLSFMSYLVSPLPISLLQSLGAHLTC